MDWSGLVGAGIGVFATLVGIELQARRSHRHETERWFRDERLARYTQLLQTFDVYFDALHFNLADWDHDDVPPPQPIPAIGNARQDFERAKTSVVFIGPSEVAAVAVEMGREASLFFGTVSIVNGGASYYPYWRQHHRLRRRYVEACMAALGTSGSSIAPDPSWNDWRESFLSDED